MFGVGRLARSYVYDLRIQTGTPHAQFLRKISPNFAEYRRMLRDMLVCEKHKYVYVINRKVASTTICNLLYELNGNTPLSDTDLVWDLIRKEFEIPLYQSGKQFEAVCCSPNYYRFSFVRNPFDRIVSAYDWMQRRIETGRSFDGKFAVYKRKNDPRCDAKTKQSMSFRKFVEGACSKPLYEQNKHWRPQYDILKCHLISYDFIGKFENFENEIGLVLKRFDASPYILERTQKRTNPSVRKGSVRDHFDSKLADLVRHRYQKDFEHFGYSLDLPE